MTKPFFNKAAPSVMHIDLNSCFASVEQQANPNLRGKPIAVAAYDSPSGCILAVSVEAKRLGVKVGMRVKEGKQLSPGLKILTPDSDKYRFVHKKLRKIMSDYTDRFYAKSIDEFALHLERTPAERKGILETGMEIKKRIKQEVGEWLTVSIGVSTNRFLAKTGAGLNKPDGLDVIDSSNYEYIYEGLDLKDLCGIDKKNEARLNKVGIYSVMDFYRASVPDLKAAFCSISGYYWYLRLRGFEIDDVESGRKSFGNSYSIPQRLVTVKEIAPILTKLVFKTTQRMRMGGFKARGMAISMLYKEDGGVESYRKTVEKPMFDSRLIYKEFRNLFCLSSQKYPVRTLSVTCFELVEDETLQLCLFESVTKNKRLMESVDKITKVYGSYTLFPARMLSASKAVPDRIGFGNVREMF